MKLIILALHFLITLVVSAKVSYKNYKVYKIIPKDQTALNALKELEIQAQSSELSRFQFWHGATKIGNEANLMLAPELQMDFEVNYFQILNVNVSVMIADVEETINNENRRQAKINNLFDWTKYNTLDEINQWLEELPVRFPGVVTILKPGKTHLSKDIVGVRLDFTPDKEKKVVFIESNIHAREWITSAVSTYILNEFLQSSDPEVKTLAEKYTWYFFPVMNPDGFAYTHETDRMWRKTRTRYNIFCYGADPNRNWGYKWMEGGASSNPCSDIYAGPEPFSEPSVRVMKDFIESISENMIAYLDFHSYSQMLLVPFGHTTDPLQNYDEMMEIAKIAMEDLKAVHGTEYVYGNVAETIYIASGSSMDWVKGQFEIPIAFTYELRDKGQFGFLLPAEQIIETAEETLISILSIFREYWRKIENI